MSSICGGDCCMMGWDCCCCLSPSRAFYSQVSSYLPVTSKMQVASLTSPHQAVLCRSLVPITGQQDPRGVSMLGAGTGCWVNTPWASLGEIGCWSGCPSSSLGGSWVSANPCLPGVAPVGGNRCELSMLAVSCGCGLLALCPSLEAGQGVEGFTYQS